jgi:putative DNA primase/helicase
MFDSPAHYPANHGQDLTDWFVRHGRTVAELNDLLASAQVVEKPQEPEIDPGVLRFFKGRKFAPALLAKAIMQDLDIVSDPQTRMIYRWEGRFWESYDRDYIEQKGLVMLGDEANSARAADAANMICKLSTLPTGRTMNDNPDLICLESGMFNVVNGELTPHDRKCYATHMLPIRFDTRHVPDCPTWKRCLREWMVDEATIREAQKFAGYCLTRETRYERMLLLYGPGGDGKSTFMNILRALVGQDNCGHVPMGKLQEQFYLSMLVNKLINMSTEVEQQAMQSMEIKAIISGDPVTAAFKNKDPFPFKPFCKLIYSTNRLPRVLDNSDGFFRKVLLIEFNGQFVKKGAADIFLMDQLLEELPGIFAWALAGLEMLREDRGFRESEPMKESIADYRRFNNNILYFIDRHIEANKAGKVAKGKLYEEYVRRCKGWNLLPQGEPTFCKEFPRLLRDKGIAFSADQKTYSDDGERRVNAYGGFSLVDEKDEGGFDLSPAPLSGGARHE